ncbi:MAG: DUF2442 domain-containing protein [Gammaproteobacteria bacterium]
MAAHLGVPSAPLSLVVIRRKDTPVGKVLNVEEPSPGHFYWPDLDVDLGLETIVNPEKISLKAK